MADRILGPAYPALLAPGLRVCTADGLTGTLVPDPGKGTGCGTFWDGPRPARGTERHIDYADPHTRDRVWRALTADEPETHLPRAAKDSHVGRLYGDALDAELRAAGFMVNPSAEVRLAIGARALRALAAAVWGPR